MRVVKLEAASKARGAIEEIDFLQFGRCDARMATQVIGQSRGAALLRADADRGWLQPGKCAIKKRRRWAGRTWKGGNAAHDFSLEAYGGGRAKAITASEGLIANNSSEMVSGANKMVYVF